MTNTNIVRYEKLEPRHAPAMKAIESAIEETDAGNRIIPKPLKEYERQLADSGYAFFGAALNGELVAFGAIRHASPNEMDVFRELMGRQQVSCRQFVAADYQRVRWVVTSQHIRKTRLFPFHMR